MLLNIMPWARYTALLLLLKLLCRGQYFGPNGTRGIGPGTLCHDPIAFYNVRIIIPDTAAMLLNIIPWAHYAALLL